MDSTVIDGTGLGLIIQLHLIQVEILKILNLSVKGQTYYKQSHVITLIVF